VILRFSLNILHSHWNRFVIQIGFSLKKIQLEHKLKTRYAKSINISDLLEEFYAKVNMVLQKDIICLDEISSNSC